MQPNLKQLYVGPTTVQIYLYSILKISLFMLSKLNSVNILIQR